MTVFVCVCVVSVNMGGAVGGSGAGGSSLDP